MKILWKTIWNLSELTGIGIGRFAPYVFGKIIGVPGSEVDSLGMPLPRQRNTSGRNTDGK